MQTLVPSSAAEAVANGAQLLDEKHPGWWREINLNRLNIRNPDCCVCGQLSTNWWNFARDLTGTEQVELYGFRASGLSGDYSYITFEDLNVEWKLAIKTRLAADKIAKDHELQKEMVIT